MKMPVFKLNLPPKIRNYPLCGQKKWVTEKMRVLPGTLAGLAMKIFLKEAISTNVYNHHAGCVTKHIFMYGKIGKTGYKIF